MLAQGSGVERRLDPALLVHTTPIEGRRRLVAQASAGRPPLILNDPRALAALAALPGRFDRAAAVAAWESIGIPEASRAKLWSAFEDAGLFADARDGDGGWWDELEWREARAYHEATRDYPFLQMDEAESFDLDSGRMRGYRDENPPPSVYQHLGAGSIKLPRAGDGESPDEWLARLSERERRSHEGIALLLDVCFGARGRIRVADGSACLLKSIPSGGARHPTEVFLAIFDLEGVGAGVYHYDVEHHGLELVRGGAHRDAFAHATLDLFSKHDSPPAAALVFTSLVERAMWRYREPRSFRAILADVGHAVSAYRRVARTLGFRTFAYQKMRDAEISKLTGTDPVAQPPLCVGTLV